MEGASAPSPAPLEGVTVDASVEVTEWIERVSRDALEASYAPERYAERGSAAVMLAVLAPMIGAGVMIALAVVARVIA